MTVQFRIDHTHSQVSTRTVTGTNDTCYYRHAVVVFTSEEALDEEHRHLVDATRGLMLRVEFAAQDGSVFAGPDATSIGGLAVPQGAGAWDWLIHGHKVNHAAYQDALAVLAQPLAPLFQVVGWARNEDEVEGILERTNERLAELGDWSRDTYIESVPEGTRL